MFFAVCVAGLNIWLKGADDNNYRTYFFEKAEIS
jgi:hypothetical protein